jgi:predicted transposase YbfD/YdcC
MNGINLAELQSIFESIIEEFYPLTVYYISSQKLKVEIFAQRIKGHWLIENQVHWVKDVNFNEDKSRIKGINVADKFSLLVTLILNIYLKNLIFGVGNFNCLSQKTNLKIL